MAIAEIRGRLPRALVRGGTRSPRIMLLGWSCVAAIASLGVFRLHIETSTDSVLDRNGPSWAFYQESQRRFGGDEIITYLIDGPSPFDALALDEVVERTREFERFESVWRVDSLSTVPLIHSSLNGDLSMEPALANWDIAGDHTALIERIRADRIAPRTLVSVDERAFAVNVVLEQGAEHSYQPILKAMNAGGGYRALVSGVPVFRVAADERTRSELMFFVPATVLVVGLLLFIMFGSIRAVVIPMGSSALGTWIMLGAMGGLGVPMTISTVVLPSILLALGCAYSVHLLVGAVRSAEADSSEPLLEVSLPIALSGLTTALGFIAISLIRIEAIRNIGAFGALGVLLVCAATLTAGPAALELWPLPLRPLRMRRILEQRVTPAIVNLASNHGRLVIGVWLITMAVVSIGITQLRVETDVIRWFPRDDPIRSAYDEIRERLSGISPMNVVIEAKDNEDVGTAEVIAAIDRLSNYLESLPEVGRVLSIADSLRQLHGGFIGDSSSPLPTDDLQVAQYLLLLESKAYVHDLITPDRSSANIRLRVDDNASGALLRVARLANEWWLLNGVKEFTARTTGIMYEFGRAEDAIAYGQIWGLVFAFVTVSAILFAIFRWALLAVVAILPNAIPIAMGFGAMGLLGVPLDAGTVVIGNLAFGIAVDDSIHAVTAYYSRRSLGLDNVSALEGAFESILPPLVFTTVAVSLGFVVLGFSGFTLIRDLGLLTAGLMVLCLLADTLLLPALLSRLGPPPDRASTAEAGPNSLQF